MRKNGFTGIRLRKLAGIIAVISATIAILSCGVRGDSGFDLVGPKMELTVTRGGKLLPISSVPNFQAGDRLWVHTDFPADQSVHYLLIVAFLQGPTNPPPEKWFTRVETWSKQAREEGTMVTVPKDAQQALMFLAPETAGDFGTLRSTVRGKPGMFVRASEDLNQASLDRTRVDKYLQEVHATSTADPADLPERTKALAQTLHLKVNQDCFERPTDQQASCLTQDTDSLALNDAHSESMVAALTSGPNADIIGTVTSTPVVAAQYYSPYVGSVMDLARALAVLRTAQYQYIPALVLPHEEDLNLRLNTPPSFHNPKSVLVIGLPAVESAQMPPLRPVDAKQVVCLQKSPMILPVVGAPLVFSTSVAHDFVLKLQNKAGTPIVLPATADAASGGLVVDTRSLKTEELPADVTGTIHGSWGFEAYDGPMFQFKNGLADKWSVAAADSDALVVGREDTIHAKGDCAACVEKVTAQDSAGKTLAVTWKQIEPGQLEVSVPLKDEQAGAITLQVKQYGLTDSDVLKLSTYTEAARLDGFAINAGDRQGVLTGTRLDEVGSLDLNGVHFVPAKLTRTKQQDALDLATSDSASVAGLQANQKEQAHVALKDGRVLNVQTTVEAPRPKVSLVSKSVQPESGASAIHLGDANELPQDRRLSFFIQSEVPDAFSRTEKIEVATVDGSFDAMLSVDDGGLVLQDSTSVLAVLDPQKAFGPSAFGPLQFRPVAADGSKGDWQPLADLVRIPTLTEVHCPDAPDKQCRLSGTNLFLLDSVSSDQAFTNGVPVPPGYTAPTVNVPRPNGTLLYVKLRDNPGTVDFVALPVLPDQD